MGKNLKYGEFSFSTPKARPSIKGYAYGGEASKSDKAQDKAMITKAIKQHDAQQHSGSKGTALHLKKGGEPRKNVNVKLVGMKLEPEAVVKKELSILKKGKAPAKIIKHEEREALMPEMGAKAYKMGGKVEKYAQGGSPADDVNMMAKESARMKSAKPQQQRGRGAMTEREMQMMRQQREEQMDRAQNKGYEQHYSDMERENRSDRQAVTDALMYVPRKIGEGARSAYDSVMGKKAGGEVKGYAFGGTPTGGAPMGSGAPQTQSNLQGAAGMPQYAQQAAQSGMPNQQQQPSPLSQMSKMGQSPSGMNLQPPPTTTSNSGLGAINQFVSGVAGQLPQYAPQGLQRAAQQAQMDRANNAPTPPAWYQDMVAKQGGIQQGISGAMARAQQAQPRSNPMSMGDFGNPLNRNPSIKQGVGAAIDRAKEARAADAARQAQQQAQTRPNPIGQGGSAIPEIIQKARNNSSGLGFNKGGSAKKGVPTYNRNPKC